MPPHRMCLLLVDRTLRDRRRTVSTHATVYRPLVQAVGPLQSIMNYNTPQRAG
jgi:hypothetical protein